jgi:hypothetical protein
MAVAALIKFVQGVNVGAPGVALVGATGSVVTASAVSTGDAVARYSWTWLDLPTGSTIPGGEITRGLVSQITFNPDVKGDYHLLLEAFGQDGKRAFDKRVFRVLDANGLPWPAFTAEAAAMNFGGNPDGWKPDMEAWFERILEADGGGGGGGGAAARAIEAKAATPAWYVIGSFYAANAETANLEILGCVTDGGLSLNARLFDVTAKAVVAGSSATITALIDGRAVSSSFSLIAGHLYQMQAECVGGSTGFGVVTSMSRGTP